MLFLSAHLSSKTAFNYLAFKLDAGMAALFKLSFLVTKVWRWWTVSKAFMSFADDAYYNILHLRLNYSSQKICLTQLIAYMTCTLQFLMNV